MNPYAVIPEDHEEEVRKRIRDRDEAENKVPNKRRRRVASTLTSSDEEDKAPSKRPRRVPSTFTLTSSQSSSSSLSPPPPKPEENLGSYTQQRLEEGLQYVISTAAAKQRRDDNNNNNYMTPRTRNFFKIYREAYEKALLALALADLYSNIPENENENESVANVNAHTNAHANAHTKANANAAISVVQALDQVYDTEGFYFRPWQQGKDKNFNEQLQTFVKLRQLEMLANYGDGDYLLGGQELQEGIRAEEDLKEEEVAKVEVEGGTQDEDDVVKAGTPFKWVSIADELAGSDALGIACHIRVASAALGIDAEHMSWLIEQWGSRSATRKFHNSIREYVQECRWSKLQALLCRDLKELCMVMGVSTDDEGDGEGDGEAEGEGEGKGGSAAKKYEKVILKVAHEYFDIDDYEDPDAWYLNGRARGLLREKTLKEEKDKGKEESK